MSAALRPLESVTPSILVLRGQKVLLDSDLAALYGVTTLRFNEQVKRNLDRFQRISCLCSMRRNGNL